MKPWDNIISEEEQRAYRAAGFGRPGGVGSRPALLIIDVQYRTVGTQPRPFWEAIKEFPTSCGEVGWHAVANIRLLLAEFRKRKWPVLYPHVAPKVSTDGGRLAEKVPAIMNIAARYALVCAIGKHHPATAFDRPAMANPIPRLKASRPGQARYCKFSTRWASGRCIFMGITAARRWKRIGKVEEEKAL